MKEHRFFSCLPRHRQAVCRIRGFSVDISIFEGIMIFCFGAAWPLSIYKSWTSRSTKGKSLIFLCVVLTGYGAGILHKVFYSWNLIVILYIANAVMVAIDIGLYFRNKRLFENV